MKKIISIMLIGMIIVGCGKTARLERLGREREAQIAVEQARIEAARLTNRSFWGSPGITYVRISWYVGWEHY